jgi:hypothetical protein
MKLARITKAARQSAGWMARAAGLRTLPPQELRVTITLHQPDNKRRDAKNWEAACKAYIDGIADVCGIDDHFWRITFVWGDVIPGGKVVVELHPIAVNVELRGVV